MLDARPLWTALQSFSLHVRIDLIKHKSAEISIDWKDEDLSLPKHPYQYGKLSPYRDSSIAKSKFNMYISDAVDRKNKKE
jgi:hypothetical protein